MKKTIYILLLFLTFIGCEKDDSHIKYTSLINLRVENDNAEADNFSKIKLIVELPSNFKTEDDQKVDFIVFKDIEENLTEEIRLVNDNGQLKKIAEVEIKHNIPSTLKIKAIIKINGVETSKETFITFKKAYPNELTVNSNVLEIEPQNFNSVVNITTKLVRDFGFVSLNSIVNTKAYDINNNEIGIFINYKNKTDINGEVSNSFTLGDNNYTGPIKIVSTTVNNVDEEIFDELIIFSNN